MKETQYLPNQRSSVIKKITVNEYIILSWLFNLWSKLQTDILTVEILFLRDTRLLKAKIMDTGTEEN